jgi:hypothetical protein
MGGHVDLCGALEDESQGLWGGEFFVGLILFFFLLFILFFDVVFHVIIVEVVVIEVFFVVVEVFVLVLVFELIVAVFFVIGVPQDGEVLAGSFGGWIAVDELRIGLEVGGDVVADQVAKISGAVGCRHRILVGHGKALLGGSFACPLDAGCRKEERRKRIFTL